MTGRADFWTSGEWNAVCFECGRKRKASTLKKNWQGYYVCKEHWEPRQPQDFVRSVPDVITPPWAQPPADTFNFVCTLEGRTAVADVAVAQCAVADWVWNEYAGAVITPPTYCTFAVAGIARASCAIADWAGPEEFPPLVPYPALADLAVTNLSVVDLVFL